MRGEIRLRRIGPRNRAPRFRALGPRAVLAKRDRRRRRCRSRHAAGAAGGTRTGDPDGRARGSEPAPAHVRHRNGHPALRGRRGRHALPDPRHAQDGARPSSFRPPGGPRWRRLQSPVRSLRDGAHQGQPQAAGGRRGGGRRRSAGRRARRDGDRGRGRNRRGAPCRCRGRDRLDLDRQPDARDRRALVPHRSRSRLAAANRSFGRHDARPSPRVCRGGSRRGLGRGVDPFGDGRRYFARALPRVNDRATDVLVLGTGVAGCSAALAAAREGAAVTLVTRASDATESNTYYAQGGIVARPEGDTPEALAADIERAGDRLCWPEAVMLLDREGPGFHWTLEGGHGIPRVLHVKDETGAPIERALVDACGREPNIHWRIETSAVDLLTRSHDSIDPTDRYRPPAVVGAYLLERAASAVAPQLAKETILATGG